MKLDEKTTRALARLILFGVVLYAAVMNLNEVKRALEVLLGIISPVLLGLVLAFLLSIPVNLFEKRIIKPRGKHLLRLQKGLRRPLSVFLSVLIILAVLSALSVIIVPRLLDAVTTLFNQLPGWSDDIKARVAQFTNETPEVVEWVESLSIDWTGIRNAVMSFLRQGVGDAMDSAVNVASSVFGGATSMALTFIIALSVVAQKEKLCSQTLSVTRAFFKEPVAARIIDITRQTSRAFSGFITAQVLEACILGSLVGLGMLILRFPHALLITAMVAVTGVIPIFGAFFSAFVGALLIMSTAGLGQALWFVLFFVVLQQLEGNLIYPRVMGSNVGLPALWVLVAITVGGGAMGVLGMLISVPLFAVAYSLLRDAMRVRKNNTGGIDTRGQDA